MAWVHFSNSLARGMALKSLRVSAQAIAGLSDSAGARRAIPAA
jgi:hypothetical protein